MNRALKIGGQEFYLVKSGSLELPENYCLLGATRVEFAIVRELQVTQLPR